MVASLQSLVLDQGECQIGLWGTDATGKTHLLNASADFARRHKVRLQIYDAVQLSQCDADDFTEFSRCDVLVVDNLDAIVGSVPWETCFYQIMNRCRAGEFRFLFALSNKPEALATVLEDFRSRLQWGLLLQLTSGGDAQLSVILQRRAQLIGLELSRDVIAYLLTHYERNLSVQIEMLRQLDMFSLSQQRRITIPLVKQALPAPSD